MSLSGQASVAGSPVASGVDRRVVGLDGLRGLMTLMVIVAHDFGEVPHGIPGAMFAWVAVDMFFVLSGYLFGQLILERQHHANFFSVFYLRRLCRILPAYLITVLALAPVLQNLHAPWIDAEIQFPLWSYLTFTQNFFMVGADVFGPRWLLPTWTLALEVHFYLIIPAVIVFTPRRYLVPLLMAAGALAVALRIAVDGFGFANPVAALVLLPAKADVLAFGVLAAIAVNSGRISWPRFMPFLRVWPLVSLVATSGLGLEHGALFGIFGPMFVGSGCAAFILCIVHGAPEGRRFESRFLRFFGDISYSLYLTHLPILGLMHGLILGTRPDLATSAQWGVTLGALPVSVAVAWGLTKLVEEPVIRLGRTLRWSAESRVAASPRDARPTLSS